MKGKEPTDIEVDQSGRQDNEEPKPADLLASKLTQLYVEIQSDNEEFANRHRIWFLSEAPSPSFATAPQIPAVLLLELAFQRWMRDWFEYETLYGHKNDPTLLTQGVFAEMPFMHVEKKVFTRDGTDPVGTTEWSQRSGCFRASHAAGARGGPTESCRTCNASLGMKLPLRDSTYWVWKIETSGVLPFA